MLVWLRVFVKGLYNWMLNPESAPGMGALNDPTEAMFSITPEEIMVLIRTKS